MASAHIVEYPAHLSLQKFDAVRFRCVIVLPAVLALVEQRWPELRPRVQPPIITLMATRRQPAVITPIRLVTKAT